MRSKNRLSWSCIFFVFLLIPQFLFSYNLTFKSSYESLLVADNWLKLANAIPLAHKPSPYLIYSIKDVETIEYKGIALCYIFHLNPQGHILVPACHELVPIKSFSLVTNFDSKSAGYEDMVLSVLRSNFDFLMKYRRGENEAVEGALEENFSNWEKFSKYFSSIKIIDNANIQTGLEKTRKYDLLLDNKLKILSTEAPALLQSDWHQRDPFNLYCPELNGQRCLVGCVATAMSQIMRYFKWPAIASGNKRYWWTNGSRWLETDFFIYVWGNMPNSKNDYDTQAEKNAVATLCRDAGYSVEMNYGTDVSLASVASVEGALQEYFGYHPDVTYINYSSYGNINDWFQILKEQRDLKWPCELGIAKKSTTIGHAVVADGYLITDTLKKVHINMGWQDSNKNAYYTLDNIDGYDDLSRQCAVINITPDIIDLSYTVPSAMYLNNSYILEFYIENTGYDGNNGYLDISFPTLANSSNISIYDKSNDWTSLPPPYNTNDPIWHRTKGQIAAQYPLISGYKDYWYNLQKSWIKVKITPAKTGTLKIYLRGTIGPSINPVDLTTNTIDQQGWPVKEIRINVVSPTTTTTSTSTTTTTSTTTSIRPTTTTTTTSTTSSTTSTSSSTSTSTTTSIRPTTTSTTSTTSTSTSTSSSSSSTSSIKTTTTTSTIPPPTSTTSSSSTSSSTTSVQPSTTSTTTSSSTVTTTSSSTTTTSIPLPSVPVNPTPSDGATNISRDTDLNWDDSVGADSYDVYFGKTSPPPYYGVSTKSSYDLAQLEYGTHYYWRIVAKNAFGQTPGEEWDFTTTRVKWKYQTGDAIRADCAALNTDGTVIYIGSGDNKLYALNANGTKKWDFNTGDGLYAAPVVSSSGVIYISTFSTNKLYALNPDGTKKWEYQFPSGLVSSPAIASDGTIYIGVGNSVYALNSDGSLKWEFNTGGTINYSPIIGVEGTIFSQGSGVYLFAINPNGTEKWSVSLSDWVYSSPSLDANGVIYTGAGNYLFAVNPDGTIKWNYPTGRITNSSPAIDENGTVYLGSSDKKLYAINSDGTLKWTYTTGGAIESSPAIGKDGTIYVGSIDGKLYALNPDGTKIWESETDNIIASSPTVANDGTVYIGSYDHYLYALVSDSEGLSNSYWPKIHHDERNTGSVESCPRLGDVNGDKNITPSDAQKAFEIYLEKIVPTPCQRVCSDSNCDGKTTPADAQLIFEHYLEKRILPEKCTGNAYQSMSLRESILTNTGTVNWIKVGKSRTEIGEKVIIPVEVSNPSGIKSFGMDLKYDDTKLEFIGVRKTSITKDFIMVDGNKIEKGIIRVGGYNTQAIENRNTGAIIELIFKGREIKPVIEILNLVDDLKMFSSK